MCYSYKTSLISYILGMISAIFAFFTRQYVLGCLIFSYAQMQLSELMIWKGLDTNNIKLNETGTTFGKYLLATHNMAIGLGIILSVLFISKRKLKLTDIIPLIVGIIFFICISLFVYLPKNYPSVTYPYSTSCKKECNNPENRLKWPYPHSWYIFSYIISIIIMFIWIKPQSSRFIFLLLFSLSFLIAAVIYPNTVGSVWCWSTSFIAPAIVLINYYFIRNEKSINILT